MSIECGHCERDLRAGHAEDCPRHPKNLKKAEKATPPPSPLTEAHDDIHRMAQNEWDEEIAAKGKIKGKFLVGRQVKLPNARIKVFTTDTGDYGIQMRKLIDRPTRKINEVAFGMSDIGAKHLWMLLAQVSQEAHKMTCPTCSKRHEQTKEH